MPAGLVTVTLLYVSVPANFPYQGQPLYVAPTFKQKISRASLSRLDLPGALLLLGATLLLVTVLLEAPNRFSWHSKTAFALCAIRSARHTVPRKRTHSHGRKLARRVSLSLALPLQQGLDRYLDHLPPLRHPLQHHSNRHTPTPSNREWHLPPRYRHPLSSLQLYDRGRLHPDQCLRNAHTPSAHLPRFRRLSHPAHRPLALLYALFK